MKRTVSRPREMVPMNLQMVAAGRDMFCFDAQNLMQEECCV